MTVTTLNGIRLSWTDHGGDGPTVVLVMGTGSPGRVWDAHQVPALRGAGLRVVTVDNRGVAPSDECGDGFTDGDMAADLVALVEHLDVGPVMLVGTSLGSRIVIEAALARPDLVSRVVAMGAHARLGPVQRAFTAGEIALADSGVELPQDYHGAVSVQHYLSPATLRDERAAEDWLDVVAFAGSRIGPGHRAQLQTSLDLGDRRADWARLAVPLQVIAFTDDLATPRELGREVADAVPGARYAEIADAGHYGYLEQPARTNRAVLEFLVPDGGARVPEVGSR